MTLFGPKVAEASDEIYVQYTNIGVNVRSFLLTRSFFILMLTFVHD